MRNLLIYTTLKAQLAADWAKKMTKGKVTK